MTQRITLGQIVALFCECRKPRHPKKEEEYRGLDQDALGAMGTHRLASFPVKQRESPLNSAASFKQPPAGSLRPPLDYGLETVRASSKLKVGTLIGKRKGEKWAFFSGKGVIV